MKLPATLMWAFLAFAFPAVANAQDVPPAIAALPHADIAKLIGSWEVRGLPHVAMTYEFQLHTMIVHGTNVVDGQKFELSMDADYRASPDDNIWVIASHPKPAPKDAGPTEAKPSLAGIHMVDANQAVMAVSQDEQFTLVRVH